MTLKSEELNIQIIYSLLLPAARMAATFGIPLRKMKQLLELAYYQESKKRHLKMKDIRKLMSVSMSKVGLLSKHLKEHFSQPDTQFGLPRKILSLLWASPLSESRIIQALDEFDVDTIRKALAEMVREKRLKLENRRTPLYRLGLAQYRQPQDMWISKLDGLNNLLFSVARTVEARFLRDDGRAFARTLNFRVPSSALSQLIDYYKKLFDLVCELDSSAEESDSIPINLSMLWALDKEQE